MIKRFFKAGVGFLLIAGLIFGLYAPSVSAYSFYGEGTDGNPYRIFTCEQLQEINDDLDGVYKVYRTVDCTGVSFEPIGSSDTPFTGTLDGRGNTVIGISIDSNAAEVGVFGAIEEGTVTNIRFDNLTIEGTSNVGGLVGVGTYANISRVYIVDGSVLGSSNYVGGIVGYLGGGSINEAAIVGVSVRGFAFVGGIAGQMVGPATIANTFASGANLQGISGVGGLVGIIGGGPTVLNNSYSAMNIISNGTEIGGLVGNNTGNSAFSITNLFSASSLAGTLTADPQSRGGAFGAQQGTISNVYFDVDRSGLVIGCSGTDSTNSGCTAINTSNNSPDYFINNSTNGPLSSWDFDENGPWVALEDDFPTLIDLLDKDQTIPNEGDANGDGIQDVLQPNVYNVQDSSLNYTTIEIPASSGCLVEDGAWYSNASNQYGNDATYTPQTATFTGFKVYCDTTGASVEITLIYDGDLIDTNGSILRQLNTDAGTFATIPGAVSGTRDINGTPRTTVTYTLTDGGAYDTDGVADGVISDPVAPALYSAPAEVGVPNTGVKPSSVLPFVAFAGFGVLMAGAGVLLFAGRRDS